MFHNTAISANHVTCYYECMCIFLFLKDNSRSLYTELNASLYVKLYALCHHGEVMQLMRSNVLNMLFLIFGNSDFLTVP